MATEPEQGGDKGSGRWHHLRDALSDRLLELGQKKGQAASEAELSFNVVFTGKLTLPEAQAVANIAVFFKLGQDNARRLLQAGRIFKTYNDKMPADKLARLLTRAGAECRVDMEAPEVDHDEPTAVQRAAFALRQVELPNVRLPDARRFGRREWGAAGVVAVLLLAAGLWMVLRPPVIGGETMADYEASVEKLVAHADPAQAGPIRHAVALLTEASRQAQADSVTADPRTSARLAYAPVRGKTAAEVIAMAEARLEKKRQAYRDGLADADRKIAEVDQQLEAMAPGNARILGKIQVLTAAFGWPAAAPAPTLAFTVRNSSNETLLRVYLQGYLYDEGNRLLASAPITYTIANGIAPGASASAALPTFSDSPWVIPSLRGRQGLMFRVRVANAENMNGVQLGEDYRPLENERERQLQWKAKVQAQLDAMKL